MLRSKGWVIAFIAVQVLVPLALFVLRIAQEGWTVTGMFPISWQMYSA
ncbi:MULTISPECIES: hypothetical protein [unclassified Blastococcus]